MINRLLVYGRLVNVNRIYIYIMYMYVNKRAWIWTVCSLECICLLRKATRRRTTEWPYLSSVFLIFLKYLVSSPSVFVET